MKRKSEIIKMTPHKESHGALGRIPKEWEVANLSDRKFCEIIMGQSPPSECYNDEGRGVPFIQGNAEFGEIHPKPVKFTTDYPKTAKENDILVSVRAPVGDVNIADKTICIGRGVAAIRFTSDSYLFYFYLFQSIKKTLEIMSVGSTFKAVTLGDLKRLTLPRPPINEQRRIAEILGTVDKAIQKIDAAIARTERLKKGLMNRLLTKGIGHAELKQTAIGKIPATWKIHQLTDEGIAKIRGRSNAVRAETVAFIPMDLIPLNGIFAEYEIRTMKEVSSCTYCEAGDVLVPKITPSLENGKQGIVPVHVPNGFALATTEVFPIICLGLDSVFLFYLLKHPKFRKPLEHSMIGTTGRQRVQKDALEKLKIPVPTVSEQRKIAEILSTTDMKLELQRKFKKRLERIKRGLMTELLTGRRIVRT